jgi:hypothetical protein
VGAEPGLGQSSLSFRGIVEIGDPYIERNSWELVESESRIERCRFATGGQSVKQSVGQSEKTKKFVLKFRLYPISLISEYLIGLFIFTSVRFQALDAPP